MSENENENENPVRIVQILPKHTQALCNDVAFYFSGEVTLATGNRKIVILNDINLIKEQLANLEKIIG